MLDLRADSIVYQAQTYIVTLGDQLITEKRRGKQKDKDWAKIEEIVRLLEAYAERAKVEDITQVNYVLECLLHLANLNAYPSAPTFNVASPPSILVGIPGPAGADGAPGPQGDTGLATDFQAANFSTPTVADSFSISSAEGARWDYVVTKSTGERRTGSVIGTWTPTGSFVTASDVSSDDIGGSTEDLSFSVEYLSGNIRLVATPVSGTWTVRGSRYWIPNNGTGSGPVSGVLPSGQVYIGNDTNTAQGRTLSGAISLVNNTGLTQLASDFVTNSHINSAAAIAFSKMAALTADRVPVINGSGVITASVVTSTNLASLDTTTSIQTALNLRLVDPSTTIGDLIYRNNSNNIARLPIGTTNQVLTVIGGVPSWQNLPGGISGLTTGYLPKATSSTTLGNSLISEFGSAIHIAGTLEVASGIRTQASGSYLKVKVVDIGDWDMDSSASTTVAHGLGNPGYKKIRSVTVVIRDDNDSVYYDLLRPEQSGTGVVNGGVDSIDSTYINLVRLDQGSGGDFDSTLFNSSAFNRGWVTIIYEA
jgi:hypothetical protein